MPLIPWRRVWPDVRDVLVQAAPGSTVSELLPVVIERVGIQVTATKLSDACRAYEGIPATDLIGSDWVPVAGRAVQPAAHPMTRPVSLSAADGIRRVIATGDWHSPYHDDTAVEVLLAAINHVRPDVVVLLGDIVDCFTVSRFDKDPDRAAKLIDEVQVTNDLLDAINVPEVHYIEGNHEHRLPRYLAQKAPELWGMVSMRQLLKVDQRGWHWHDYRADAVRIGRMAFKHDIGRAGKYAAHHTLADYGGNITFGHTHRGGTVYQNTVKGTHRVCLNTGWLGDVDAIDYRHREMARRDYNHGFGLVYVDERTDNVFAQFKPIIGGSCEVEGTLVGPEGPLARDAA